MLIEEAAFIDPLMFKSVIVPIMGMCNVAVLAISTPDDQFNYFTELMNKKKPDGTPLFSIIDVGLTCRACVEKGELSCPHKVNRLPAWKNRGRQELVQSLLEDDVDLCMRETKGVIVSDKKFVFRDWLPAVEAKPRYQLQTPVNVVYVAIDPSGGGTQSDYAIVSMAHVHGRQVV